MIPLVSVFGAEAESAAVRRAPFEIIKPAYPTVIFDSETVPAGFSASAGSRLEITRAHFRSDAGRALKFSWNAPGGKFSWNAPGAFAHINGGDPDPSVYQWCVLNMLSAFELWVFNERASGDRVWFEIGTATRTDARFYMNLDFTGWRRLSAMYGRDIRAIPGADADTLRVFAPKTEAKGELVFDLLAPRNECDPRFVNRTPEAPWVKNREAAKAGGGLCTDPAIANMASVTPRKVDMQAPSTLDAEQSRALETLTGRYFKRSESPVAPADFTPREIETLRAAYAEHGVVRTGAAVSGNVLSPRQLWANIAALAKARERASGRPGLRAEFERKALDLVDLVIQYGHGSWYGADDAFVRPMLRLREPLESTGRWRPMLARLREIYVLDELDSAEVYGNADAYNTWLHGQLGVILLGDNGPGKWRDLLALRRYLDHTADFGELKGDGSAFHHDMTYSGYGNPAVESLGDMLLVLKGSPFFPERMHEVVRRAARAMRFYSCEADMPHYFGGRWRTLAHISPKLYRDLADCGEPGVAAGPDREMAAIYLGYGIRDEAAARYAAAGIRPYAPSGHLTLPYSVSAFHRREDWMVSVHGQKKEFRAAEAYGFQNGNTMGRYISFGQTSIHSKRPGPGKPVGAEATGLVFDKGWDYARWPGTTARALPHDALRSHFEVEEMTTAEGHAGGVSLDGDGLFAMKLREDIPGETEALRLGPTRWWLGEAEFARRVKDSCYDTSFRARKSWFFFDDCTVCLGSGITCRDARFPINTTLFQNSLSNPGRKESFVLGGDVSPGFPLDLAAATARWMIDSCDTGYWIPANNPPLRLLRARRELPYRPYWLSDMARWASSPRAAADYAGRHEAVNANAGDMELAWFDHGAAPAAPSGYEYAFLVNATPAVMSRFATAPRYRVLRKDDTAHIVADTPTRSVGYAVFEAGDNLAAPGTDAGIPALREVSRPCLVMLRARPSGALRMSFADPDPNLKPLRGKDGDLLEWGHDGLAAPATHTRVTLSGRWHVDSTAVKIISSTPVETVLEIACVESAPVAFDLSPSVVK